MPTSAPEPAPSVHTLEQRWRRAARILELWDAFVDALVEDREMARDWAFLAIAKDKSTVGKRLAAWTEERRLAYVAAAGSEGDHG